MPLRSYKNSLKEYFAFTNRERKPIIVFLLLILILLGIQVYLKFTPDRSKIDFVEFEKDIVAFKKQIQLDSALAYRDKFPFKPTQNINPGTKALYEYAIFEFNPNNLADSLWMKLGIKESIIKTIKNYESKGGKFYKKNDLKKIYGFDEKDYARLESYILLPDSISVDRKNFISKKAGTVNGDFIHPIISFDLNTATAEDLKSIYGIGDVKANSIIKYRNMLGGFIVKEQLLEAYGIDSALFESIEKHLEIKTLNLVTINLNSAFEPQLRHPYISRQLASLIVNYRKMHGNYKSKEEIRNIPLINDELYRKLAPYLTIE